MNTHIPTDTEGAAYRKNGFACCEQLFTASEFAPLPSPPPSPPIFCCRFIQLFC